MTLAIDHPILRLIRTAIGAHTLENHAQRSWREANVQAEVV